MGFDVLLFELEGCAFLSEFFEELFIFEEFGLNAFEFCLCGGVVFAHIAEAFLQGYALACGLLELGVGVGNFALEVGVFRLLVGGEFFELPVLFDCPALLGFGGLEVAAQLLELAFVVGDYLRLAVGLFLRTLGGLLEFLNIGFQRLAAFAFAVERHFQQIDHLRVGKVFRHDDFVLYSRIL